MKLIKPTYEILHQESGLEGIYKQIEISGRTCYKSSPIEGKAKDFVDRMINSGHGAMLEHGTVYLKIKLKHDYFKEDETKYIEFIEIRNKYILNSYSKVNNVIDEVENIDTVYITTNLRVLVENSWLDDLKYLCEPTEYHVKRITVRFNTQIAVSREFNRHRADSIAEQSTRYCNYSKDKFDNEINVNTPDFITIEDYDVWSDEDFFEKCQQLWYYSSYSSYINSNNNNWSEIDYWLFANMACEFSYMNLIRLGCKPEQARSILPLDLNTELIHTAFVSDWKHFFNLRALGTTGTPHPDAKALAEPLRQEFIKLKLM